VRNERTNEHEIETYGIRGLGLDVELLLLECLDADLHGGGSWLVGWLVRDETRQRDTRAHTRVEGRTRCAAERDSKRMKRETRGGESAEERGEGLRDQRKRLCA